MIIILYDGLHMFDDHHSVRPLIPSSIMSICNHVKDNRHERYKGYAIRSQSISYMIAWSRYMTVLRTTYLHDWWFSFVLLLLTEHIFISLTCSPNHVLIISNHDSWLSNDDLASDHYIMEIKPQWCGLWMTLIFMVIIIVGLFNSNINVNKSDES